MQNKTYTIILKGKQFYLVTNTLKKAWIAFKNMFPEITNGFQLEEEYEDKKGKHLTCLKIDNSFNIYYLCISEM